MSINTGKTKNFDLEKLLTTLFWGVIIISTIFSLTIGIMGIVAFKKNEFYPNLEDIFNALKGVGIDSMHSSLDKASNSFEFMSNVMGVIGAAFIINFVIATILNFSDAPIRAIISTVSVVVCIIIGCVCIYLGNYTDVDNDIISILSGVSFIAALIILFLCFRHTAGGRIIYVTFITFLIHIVAIPTIMWLIGLGINKILSRLALLLIGGAVFIGFIYSPGGASSSSGGGSVSHSRGRKNLDKVQSEIDKLNRQIKSKEDGIKGHRKGSLDNLFVDEKVAQREIDSLQKRKSYLENQKKN